MIEVGVMPYKQYFEAGWWEDAGAREEFSSFFIVCCDVHNVTGFANCAEGFICASTYGGKKNADTSIRGWRVTLRIILNR